MENAESVKDQERRAYDVAFETDFTKRIDVENIIESVFGPEISNEVLSLHGVIEENFKTSNVLECVQACVRRNLEQIEEEVRDLEPLIDTRRGRLGSKEVRFDVSSHVGLFVVGTDRLSINSQSNFSTLRANVCFYEGKWHYEVQLGSKGIMQIGWAMGNCKFSQEIGVGDTINSYSYDGHRVRRWNVSTYPYGESWVSGDVIGSTIDLDSGSIEFYRNGHSMGEAYKNIQMGPGYSYFPAVSLAFGENLVANFGSTPLKFQVAGFHPPERAPLVSVAKADLLLKWFKNLLAYSDPRYQSKDVPPTPAVSPDGIAMIFGHLLMQHLSPLFSIPFVVEASLMPFLLDLAKKAVTPGKKAPSRTVTAVWLNMFLDMFWLFLDASEQKRCLESVASFILSRFRSVSFSVDYAVQKETLQTLTLLCRHSKTRVFLIQNVLFDKVKFANLSHMKPLDARGLREAVPVPYWKGIDEEIVDGDSKLKRYLSDCGKMKAGIIVIENMQREFIRSLMDNCDGTREQPSSRRLFLAKFRQYLHDTMLFSRQTLPVVATPLPIVLCCFHRLVITAQSLLETELQSQTTSDSLSREFDSASFSIPVCSFIDRSLNHFNIDRFGGVMTHLRKVHAAEIAQELGADHPVGTADDVHMCTSIVPRIPPSPFQATASGTVTVTTVVNNTQTSIATTMTDMDGGSAIQDTTANNVGYMLPVLARMIQSQIGGGPLPLILRGHALIPSCSTMEKVTTAGPIDPEKSLIELVDGLVLFYHLCAHKQLIKVSSLRDNMEEFESALEEMKLSLDKVQQRNFSAKIEMKKSLEVFEEKLTEMSRHMAWVRAAIFSPEKQAELAWLLRIVVRTLQQASAKGKLLSFVPEFYLDALIELTTALRSLFHPTVPIDNIPNYQGILMDVGEFICTHFADPRIVHASCKDTLVQALANFVCNSGTLKCLEMLPLESRSAMISGLLRPYENRAWAQSNWVLVRFWQGNGFAFRYNKSPHLTSKFGPRDFRLDGSLIVQPVADPCPSVVFQQQISDALINDEKLATAFINSILNQLNWAFSEFIGMLQEIQNLTSRPERPERVLIESRQLKICATCFDLTLSLLRVLEMMASIARTLFTNASRESSETLLERMCQLLCQVLNRISSVTGCFQYVVDMEIPELEPVDHFPILTAVVGILLALLQDELWPVDHDEDNSTLESSQRLGVVSRALLSEPSFQLSSLQFVLGQQLPKSSTTKLKSSSSSHTKTFSFSSYPQDITYMELEQVREMIVHLTWCQKRLSLAKEEDEDTLCSICYAYPTSAVFHPCEHISCRFCIKHHLMNNKDCFFCKTIIKKVTMTDGTVLFNSEESSENPTLHSDLGDES